MKHLKLRYNCANKFYYSRTYVAGFRKGVDKKTKASHFWRCKNFELGCKLLEGKR